MFVALIVSLIMRASFDLSFWQGLGIYFSVILILFAIVKIVWHEKRDPR
jgi:hypothetical protein